MIILMPMESATVFAALLCLSVIIGTSTTTATALSPRTRCAISARTVLSSPPEKQTAHPSSPPRRSATAFIASMSDVIARIRDKMCFRRSANEHGRGSEVIMDRHDRQMRVFGEDGQRRMAEAVVGIIGCGGLGTNVATALTVAGVGRLVLMDPDRPEITNLNRQYVYCDRLDEGRPKAEILAEWVRSRDPSVDAEFHAVAFSRETQGLLDDCDVLVDCLDSISGRMELNRYAVESGKPLVHGGIDGFIGQLAVCIPGRTPCLFCMMGSVPDQKAAPVSIGAVVSTVGSMEAAEVLKLITGREETAGSFLSMDLESWRFQRIAFERDPACPVCRSRPRSRVEVLAEVAVPSVGEHRDDIPRSDLLGQLPDGGHD